MSRQPTHSPGLPPRRMRGFEPTGGLIKDPLRAAGEKRGFVVARLLTHWAEIVGNDTARITRPVKVGYPREGLGATLTLLASSAHAPMVQMDLTRIRDRVNAAYGYNAIARVTLTQTAATGFAEGQALFTPAAKAPPTPPDPALQQEAARTAAPIRDEGLRTALEALAQNVLNRRKT